MLGKVSIPELPTGVVERARLFTHLNEAIRHPVSVVTGPPGCGKTQLLASWLRVSARLDEAAWVTLDRTDGDPVRFWTALLAAVRRVVAPPDGSLLSSLAPAPQAETPPDGFAAHVVEALAELDRPLLIVLDDVQRLEDSPVISDLSYLMLHLPPSARVVLVGHYLPGLPTSRLRLEGKLAVVTATDLAFTTQEAAIMLRQSGIAMSSAEIQILRDRTEGWSAGLRLAVLSLVDGCPVEQMLADFTGGHTDVADYLVEEVLNRLADEEQDFVLRTSICDRLTGDLASALTGRPNGHEMLLWMARRNVFTTAISPRQEWFRYHPMFSDLLRSRLDRSGGPTSRELHTTASRWYASNGLPVEAFDHAVRAGAWDIAEDVLVQTWLSLYLDGQLVTLKDFIGRLPDHVINSRPDVGLIRVATGLALGDGGLLEATDAALAGATVPAGDDEKAETTGTASTAADDHSGSVPSLVVQLQRARLSGDLRGVGTAARRLIQTAQAAGCSPQQSNDLRALALEELGITEYWAGHRAEAENHLREALAAARANGRGYVELGCLGQLIGVLTAQDRPLDALRAAEEAVELARSRGWERAGATAELWHALGWIHYVRGELDEAERYLDLAEGAVRRQDAAIHGVILMVRAMVVSLRGRKREALAMFEAADRTVRRLPTKWIFGAYIVAERARLSLAIGHTALPRAVLGVGPPDPDGSVHLAIAWAELLVSDGRAQAALDLMEKAVSCGEGFLDQRIQGTVLLSLLKAQLVGMAAAVETMAAAVAMARPQQFVQPFLHFGPPADRVLEVLERQRVPERPFVQMLRHRLAETVVPRLPEDRGRNILPEPLTQRELEVLQALDSLSTLSEISGNLYVSVNTVKVHVRSVYRKLRTNGRREAVERGRALGLI